MESGSHVLSTLLTAGLLFELLAREELRAAFVQATRFGDGQSSDDFQWLDRMAEAAGAMNSSVPFSWCSCDHGRLE